MSEFYRFSWVLQNLVTLLLGITVLAQTLAMVLNYFKYRLSAPKILDNLYEATILLEILILSLLHGQVVNGYKNGFVVLSGHERIRILGFIAMSILSIGISYISKTGKSFFVLAVLLISLPVAERILGSFYPLMFIGVIIIILGRSLSICYLSVRAINSNISALSIVKAIDTLQTGVVFCEEDGYTLLSNSKMRHLMIELTGKVHRNALSFYNVLITDQDPTKYKKAELDGENVYLLADESAWIFTRTQIKLKYKNYIHISAANVSTLWELTSKLQNQGNAFRHKSNDLKETIANLHIISKEKEIENAKMLAHDILGQRLSVLLRMIQNQQNLDCELLKSMSEGVLDELMSNKDESEPKNEIRRLQQIFTAINVNICYAGELPKNPDKALLIVDIIREAATNAVRHGLASQINVNSSVANNDYELTISNNGNTQTDSIIPGGGISTMEKKVSEQGGHIDIIQSPIFTLSIILPGGD